MRIEKTDENSFILHGKIKEFTDYLDVKSILEKRKRESHVEISFTIPQARDINRYLLGYWLKLARKDGFKFHFHISSPHLYDTFVRLGLHKFFEVYNDSVEFYL